MIKANHTALGYLFFKWFTTIQFKRYFHKTPIIGDKEDLGKSVLVIANHFSWWDGFIQFYLNQHTYKRQFHVMMLEEQLRQHMILNKGGAFSVKKNSRSLIESLSYCIELLEDKNNIVVLFPQGAIQSLYQSDFHFEKGATHILKSCGNKVQCVFNVNLIDYHSQKKPTLYIYYKNSSVIEPCEAISIEEQFNRFYSECVQKQQAL